MIIDSGVIVAGGGPYDTIQAAITAAYNPLAPSLNAIVWIPANYPNPSETYTNPNGVLIIDCRGAGTFNFSGTVTGPAGPTGAAGTSNVPWVDIQNYGGVPKLASVVNEFTTATGNFGSKNITLGAAKHFANGMGVCIWTAGAACSITNTPSAPVSATAQGVNGSGPSGTQQTITYKIVGYDAAGGLTAASAATQITTAPAVFGPVQASISSISQVGTTVTINFSSPLNNTVLAGMTLHLTGINGGSNVANGVWSIASAPSTTQVTITLPTGASIGTPTVSGALGRVSNSAIISSISRDANGIITVNTVQPHNYQVGAIVILKNISPIDLNGHFVIASTPTGSSFTCQSPVFFAEVGAGGYATVWESISLATLASNASFPANTLGYYVYSDSPNPGGTLQLIGKTLYTESHFTDWGPFYGGGYTAPGYVPTTPPSVAQNQLFTSTISSGGGTTNLVLENAITNTNGISGATIRYDDGPCLSAAISALGQGAVILSPPTVGVTDTFYVFNSPVNFGSGHDIIFATGCIINETLTIGGLNTLSAPLGTTNLTEGGQFGQTNYSVIQGLGNPMIFSSSGGVTISKLGFFTGVGSANTDNGHNAVMLEGFYHHIRDCSFYAGPNGTSCPLIFNGATSAIEISNCNFVGTSILGQLDSIVGQSNFCPPVPVLWFRVSDNPSQSGICTGTAHMIGINTFNGRAVLLDQTFYKAGTAFGFYFGDMLWNQAASQPFLMVNGSTTDLTLKGVLNDTSFAAALANWGGITRATLKNFFGAGGYPATTGAPVLGLRTDNPLVNQNVSVRKDLTGGTATIGTFGFPPNVQGIKFDEPVYISNSQGGLFFLPQLQELTLSVINGGTWSAGTHTVQLFFQGWDGGLFVASPPTQIKTSGTQQIVVSWNQESGFQGAYVSVDGQIQFTGLITGASATLSGSATFTTAPTQSGSGLPLVNGSMIITPEIILPNGVNKLTIAPPSMSANRALTLPDGNSQVILVGTLTTGSGTTDSVTIQGVTATSHVTLTPTNAAAATMILTSPGIYCSSKSSNTLVFTHGSSLAGATFDIQATAS